MLLCFENICGNKTMGNNVSWGMMKFSKKCSDKEKAYFYTKNVWIDLLWSYAGQVDLEFTQKCIYVDIIEF